MLELTKEPCKLGVYINGPTQKHGDERVPAKVLGIKNRMLTKAELNALFNDAHAWDMLYVDVPGKPAEPFWREKLGPLPLAISKFVNCEVVLSFGLKPYEVEFTEAVVKSIRLEPQTGGLTAMSFTLVCLKSNIEGDLARIDEHLNKGADIAITLGDPDDDEDSDDDDDQPELNLGHGAKAQTEGEGAEAEEELTEGQREIAAPKRRRRVTPTGDSVN